MPLKDMTALVQSSKLGLTLGGGSPAIPVDAIKRIKEKSYIKMSKLLLEEIHKSFLYPEGKSKRKAQPLETFVDWVLALAVYSKALLIKN